MDKRLPVRNFFDAAYEGTPPWDIGRPQPAFVKLAEAGLMHGRVLDVGCGTGELALELSRRGHAVVGVDASQLAVTKAREKACARGLSATFETADALDLAALGGFDTVVDCGLFHVFSDEGRRKYEESLARVVTPGGVLHVLCFSDREPGSAGPRRVSEAELRRTFRRGWFVQTVQESRFDSLFHAAGARARLATLLRMPATSLVH